MTDLAALDVLAPLAFDDRVEWLLSSIDRAGVRFARRTNYSSLDDLLLCESWRHCGECAVHDVNSCPIAKAVAGSRWAGSQWCPKCWGYLAARQQVEKDGATKEVSLWTGSGFMLLCHVSGRTYVVASCDCAAGSGQHNGILSAPGEAADYRCWPARAADNTQIKSRVTEVCRRRRPMADNAEVRNRTIGGDQ